MAQSHGVEPPVTMCVRPRACQRPGAPRAGAAPPTASGNATPGCCDPGLGVSAVRSGGDAPDCSAASLHPAGPATPGRARQAGEVRVACQPPPTVCSHQPLPHKGCGQGYF